MLKFKPQRSDYIVRRKDRQIDKNATINNLNKGEYGILSTVDLNGQPYGVPLSFCVENGKIYFHCAIAGKKIENLMQNSKVSFCVVGNTFVLPDKFSMKYKSTIVTGLAEEVYDDEKQHALESMLKKYSSAYFIDGLKYIKELFKKTRVFGINIQSITGKSNG